jgi:hypothetical protein
MSTSRVLPGGIAIAVTTRRHELLACVIDEVRSGRLVLNTEDQAEIIGLLSDLIEQDNQTRQNLRDMLPRLKGMQTTGLGMQTSAEALLCLVEGCGIKS